MKNQEQRTCLYKATNAAQSSIYYFNQHQNDLQLLIDESLKKGIQITSPLQLSQLISEGPEYLINIIKEKTPVIVGDIKPAIDKSVFEDIRLITNKLRTEIRPDYEAGKIFRISKINNGKIILDKDAIVEADKQASIFAKSIEEVEAFEALKRIANDLNLVSKAWYIMPESLSKLFIHSPEGGFKFRNYWFKERR